MPSEDTWNYRVVRRTHRGETFYAFHQAHYGPDKERPHSISVTPTHAQGETPEELAAELDKFREALAKPILEYDDY